ncbi:hypothetical protein ACT3TQ_01240 [Halomonas sp. AOP12-C2-37]|uniref:hypothetical protein n=1 Tax=unclassified Halomonas TaxID=2609666 RepID=UPI004033E67F
MKNTVESLFEHLGQLGGQIMESQSCHRETFTRTESKELVDLRCCLDGAIALIYNEANEPIEDISENIEYQLCVSASFIKTHLLLNDLILDGNLVESFVLLRKQLESLARLEELNTHCVRDLEGKTPNIRSAIEGQAGHIYGALSEIAHFSCFQVNGLLSLTPKSDHAEVDVFSRYTENSINCMKLRMYLGLGFVRWMLLNLKAWYPEKNWEMLEESVMLIFSMAFESGLIEEREKA